MKFYYPQTKNTEYKLVLRNLDNEANILSVPFFFTLIGIGVAFIYNVLHKNKRIEKENRKLRSRIHNLKTKVKSQDLANKNSTYHVQEDIADYVARRLLYEDYSESDIYELIPLAAWASRNKLGETLFVLRTFHFHRHWSMLHQNLDVIKQRLEPENIDQPEEDTKEIRVENGAKDGYFCVLRDRLTNLVRPLEADLTGESPLLSPTLELFFDDCASEICSVSTDSTCGGEGVVFID